VSEISPINPSEPKQDSYSEDSSPMTPSNPPRQWLLSVQLRTLSLEFSDRAVCLEDLLKATHGFGYHLLLLLISLPFLTPLPMPGFSVPFGLVVAFIGGRLALGKRPWLPRRLRHRQLPAGFLKSLLPAAARIVSMLEWFLRPRLVFLNVQFVYRRLSGFMIAVSGFCLLLPLPIPFSNGLPAWTILLLAAAALARDGLCFLGGCLMFILTATFFLTLVFGGLHLVQKFWPFGG
jgi:hypothetical protein